MYDDGGLSTFSNSGLGELITVRPVLIKGPTKIGNVVISYGAMTVSTHVGKILYIRMGEKDIVTK